MFENRLAGRRSACDHSESVGLTVWSRSQRSPPALGVMRVGGRLNQVNVVFENLFFFSRGIVQIHPSFLFGALSVHEVAASGAFSRMHKQ